MNQYALKKVMTLAAYGDTQRLWKTKKASLYSSVVTNTSKEMMCYSDFPMPDDFPAYLHNSKVLEYLRLYADHFRLLKYIQFETEVFQVTKSPNSTMNGQWEVLTKKNGTEKKECFDAVLVCNGHHVDHYLPLESFPGISKYQTRHLGCKSYFSSWISSRYGPRNTFLFLDFKSFTC